MAIYPSKYPRKNAPKQQLTGYEEQPQTCSQKTSTVSTEEPMIAGISVFTMHWKCLRCGSVWDSHMKQDVAKESREQNHDLKICQHCAGDPKFAVQWKNPWSK